MNASFYVLNCSKNCERKSNVLRRAKYRISHDRFALLKYHFIVVRQTDLKLAFFFFFFFTDSKQSFFPSTRADGVYHLLQTHWRITKFPWGSIPFKGKCYPLIGQSAVVCSLLIGLSLVVKVQAPKWFVNRCLINQSVTKVEKGTWEETSGRPKSGIFTRRR